MAAPEEPVTIYDAPLLEAQLAQSTLEGHGIAARLIGEHIGATYGLWSVQVIVRAADAPAAREVLEASGLLEPR
jgi:putative signal transducing protein